MTPHGSLLVFLQRAIYPAGAECMCHIHMHFGLANDDNNLSLLDCAVPVAPSTSVKFSHCLGFFRGRGALCVRSRGLPSVLVFPVFRVLVVGFHDAGCVRSRIYISLPESARGSSYTLILFQVEGCPTPALTSTHTTR